MNNFTISSVILVLYLSGSLQFTFGFDDESDCMRGDAMPCWSGGCYYLSQLCDGRVDCDDGTDENFCSPKTVHADVCNATHQYKCADGHGCIPNSWICNNETDCADGSDELNCTQTLETDVNTTCKGFLCSDGKCISKLWVCDGQYDCDDKRDELVPELCRHSLLSHEIMDGSLCLEHSPFSERSYRCLDSSYCLPSHNMCDGIIDCRDGSDEGTFCADWQTMCNHLNCSGNGTICSPDRHGPTCICIPAMNLRQYNYITQKCEDVDECLTEEPQCSHSCENADGHYVCSCIPGYVTDEFRYLCYAPGPEGMLFFSTQNDIRYLKIKSKQMVIIATGIKQAHGVSFDGTYVYWVETAEGHQSILKAQLDDIQETKQVLVGLGLEEPGDIAIDYLGGNIYFSDSERGIISACRVDGSICTTVKTQTRHPKYVTLDVRHGKMYWADWHHRALIMSAHMDGSQPDVLVDKLQNYATGLAIDSPNGRLYFVDKTIKVVFITTKKVYSLFNEPFHHPFSISVFENTIYWSDWTSNTIQTTDKIHGTAQKRNILLKLNTAIIGMHMYHPVLVNATINPCSGNNCSHLCFVTSNVSHVCACPDGMELQYNKCIRIGDYRARYLIVAGLRLFTRIQYDELGNPENHAIHFDIGRVQTMAYDSFRDALLIYDLQFKTIRSINMSDFTLGVTQQLVYRELDNVVDMDYDYATDNLYILDAGRHLVEVFSLRTQKRAYVYHFKDNEIPIAVCVIPDYGTMMVALVESDEHNRIHIDSIGLNGQGRKHIIRNNLKGPHVRLRYVQHMDVVFISDESNGAIDYVHPDGTGKENYRELSTTVSSLAVADNYVFWTDRRTPRLFWSDIHETTHKIRRIDLALFPNNTQLLIQATTAPADSQDPLLNHPCLKNVCSDVCVQEPHETPHSPNFHMGYKCLCPPGLTFHFGKCKKLINCSANEILCHKSNHCIKKYNRCDGKIDCPYGEDEDACSFKPIDVCTSDEIFCNGLCLNRKTTKICDGKPVKSETDEVTSPCTITEFQCPATSICISRSQLCDGNTDCPYGDDEIISECNTFTCYETEFMCASGSCILKSWTCDGDRDCNDGSDELNCKNFTCGPGFYQCRNKECMELRRRCDGQQDCLDYSDEEDCEEKVLVEMTEEKPHCEVWEYTCEHNTSICLPYTARCNMRVECPGGSDEHGCEWRCSRHGWFACSQQLSCIAMNRVCNNQKDCRDGSDETPDACALVNRSSHLYPIHSLSDCSEGYTCKDRQCIEWRQVCDNHTDCADDSDEYGVCLTACLNHTCAYKCQPTPLGPRCICPYGYKVSSDWQTCDDVNECQYEVCSQGCFNMPGSFVCSCHKGYALRSDHRSCKAVRGNMSILYVSGNTVRSITTEGRTSVEFNDTNIPSITDMDYHFRENKLYITSAEAGKLLEVNGIQKQKVIVITNIGKPTRIAVDWVTGNVYFVDNSTSETRLRVCHIKKKRCAMLQKLPSDAEVTSLIVDPSSRRMFYCVMHHQESVVWSASLSGNYVTDLTTVHNCTGLAVDSYKKKLYVAETGPAHISRMDYEGDSHKKLLADQSELQAPSGLVIFEDYVYYLVANSYRLGRCLLFGHKHCENYVSRLFNANTFVIRHENIQRDDLVNECESVVCSNVCALDKDGPKCICVDGTVAKNGNCPDIDKKMHPLFNGSSPEELTNAHSATLILVVSVLILVVIYMGVFVYYHFVYKPRNMLLSASYSQVRFQNTPGECSQVTQSNPTIHMSSEAASIYTHEFENPLQYVRKMWYSSFRKQIRPLYNNTAVATLNSPPQNDLSDTESDLDGRENNDLSIFKL